MYLLALVRLYGTHSFRLFVRAKRFLFFFYFAGFSFVISPSPQQPDFDSAVGTAVTCIGCRVFATTSRHSPPHALSQIMDNFGKFESSAYNEAAAALMSKEDKKAAGGRGGSQGGRGERGGGGGGRQGGRWGTGGGEEGEGGATPKAAGEGCGLFEVRGCFLWPACAKAKKRCLPCVVAFMRSWCRCVCRWRLVVEVNRLSACAFAIFRLFSRFLSCSFMLFRAGCQRCGNVCIVSTILRFFSSTMQGFVSPRRASLPAQPSAPIIRDPKSADATTAPCPGLRG